LFSLLFPRDGTVACCTGAIKEDAHGERQINRKITAARKLCRTSHLAWVAALPPELQLTETSAIIRKIRCDIMSHSAATTLSLRWRLLIKDQFACFSATELPVVWYSQDQPSTPSHNLLPRQIS
jgi:hypothetical protein